MKLYVLEGIYDYEGSSVLGIYSSKQKADEARLASEEAGKKKYSTYDGYEISVYTLDVTKP